MLKTLKSFLGDNSARTQVSRNSYDRASSKAIIYKSELDYISRCILDYPNIETGGQLFGYWTATGTPVVMYVIGPGPRAKHNYTSFLQDQDYLQPVGRELYNRYRLQHIGEWHSHHQLDLPYPSGGDLNTMQYGVGKPGFPRLLLCIGNCMDSRTTVNPFNFHESDPGRFVDAAWDVVNCNSPYRNIVDMELASILRHPRTQCASHLEINTVESRSAREDTAVRHWLTEKHENVQTMKDFLKEVEIYCSGSPVKAQMLDSGEPVICFCDDEYQVKLPFGFPDKSPVLYKLDKTESQDETTYGPVAGTDVWVTYNTDLLLRFREWLSYAMQIAYDQPAYSDDNNI